MNPFARILCLTVLLGGPPVGSVTERLQTSFDKQTGGPVAGFAICNSQAVIAFYDGHQTPHLISDSVLWHHLATSDVPMLQGLSARGQKLVHQAIQEFRDEKARFISESRGYAKAVAAAANETVAQSIREDSYAHTKRAIAASKKNAAKWQQRFARAFSREDRARFQDWLDSHRRTSVILEMDYAKVTDWECTRWLTKRIR